MSISFVFSYVLKATVFGSVTGLIIFAFKSLLLKRLSPKWHCYLWFIMLVKLIFPDGPQSKLSIFNKITPAMPFGEEELLKIAKRPTISGGAAVTSLNIAAYVWFAGFLAVLLWTLASYIIMNRQIKKSSHIPSRDTLKNLEYAKKLTGVKRNIPAVVQKHILQTSLCGMLFPKILITDKFESLTQAEMEYAFIHELSHYKRKDIAFNYLLLILQSIHWFNPITWILFPKIRRDTELATDEKTLLSLSPARHRGYGMALINAADAAARKSHAILGMASGKTDIKMRIMAIARFKKPGLIQYISGILTTVLVASVCLTSAVVAKPIAEVIYKSIPAVESLAAREPAKEISAEFEAVSKDAPDIEKPKEEQPTRVIATDGESEYICLDYRNIDTLISCTGQTLYNGIGAADMKKYAYLISYCSDRRESQSFEIIPNSTGHIQIFVEENSSYDHMVYVNICSTETPGQGWTYSMGSASGHPFFIDGLDKDTEYLVTVDTYCPGYYDIDGKILVF